LAKVAQSAPDCGTLDRGLLASERFQIVLEMDFPASSPTPRFSSDRGNAAFQTGVVKERAAGTGIERGSHRSDRAQLTGLEVKFERSEPNAACETILHGHEGKLKIEMRKLATSFVTYL
jgi:hypothetical protein